MLTLKETLDRQVPIRYIKQYRDVFDIGLVYFPKHIFRFEGRGIHRVPVYKKFPGQGDQDALGIGTYDNN